MVAKSRVPKVPQDVLESAPAPRRSAAFGWLWYGACFVAALTLLGWSAAVAHTHRLAGWEAPLFRHINNWPDNLRIAFKLCSIAKNSLWIGVLAVAIAFVLRRWRLTYRMAVAILAGAVLTALLKHEIARPRPAQLLPHVHLRWSDTGAGFPSGHAMMITVIMLSIVPLLPRWWRWVPFLPIGLVMLSRVYLGLHAPLDVIGGFAVGLLVVSTLYILPVSLKKRLRLE